jgi:hypothetical protein
MGMSDEMNLEAEGEGSYMPFKLAASNPPQSDSTSPYAFLSTFTKDLKENPLKEYYDNQGTGWDMRFGK